MRPRQRYRFTRLRHAAFARHYFRFTPCFLSRVSLPYAFGFFSILREQTQLSSHSPLPLVSLLRSQFHVSRLTLRFAGLHFFAIDTTPRRHAFFHCRRHIDTPRLLRRCLCYIRLCHILADVYASYCSSAYAYADVAFHSR